MNYYIKISSPNKAKDDIDELARQWGFANLARFDFGRGGVGRFLTKLVAVGRILTTLRGSDVLFLQYPMKKFYHLATLLAHAKGAATVAVVHDLGAFRRHKLTPEHENRRLRATDFLIVHNAVMASYLRKKGFKGGLHNLEIFDYLSPLPVPSRPLPEKTRVVYAGNLGLWRNAFLYQLDGVAVDWTLDLYGKGFDEARNTCPNLHYHGFIDSDDFIGNVDAAFGLVWDGGSVDECNGDWGEYLKINNPHKASFYLRAGIPIIVWSRAAMSSFVSKWGVGIVVENLRNVGPTIADLSPEAYAHIRSRARHVGRLLAQGYFIHSGLEAAEEYLRQRDGSQTR